MFRYGLPVINFLLIPGFPFSFLVIFEEFFSFISRKTFVFKKNKNSLSVLWLFIIVFLFSVVYIRCQCLSTHGPVLIHSRSLGGMVLVHYWLTYALLP